MRNQPNPVPDTSLLSSLRWVHTMPPGQGLTPGGPVVEYHTRQVTERTSGNQTEVVEWLYAEIGTAHLDTGSNTDKRMRKWVQDEVGVKDDQAGHIVAKRLGGLGTVKWNIFPQNANFNSGVSRFDEDTIYQMVQRTGSVKVWYHFVYDDPAHPGRPSMFQYYYKCNNPALFTERNDDQLNPVSLADARGSI